MCSSDLAITPFPWLILVKSGMEGNKVLLAHEAVHQAQMRRDGWLVFMARYATKKGRLAYEVEAYQESYRLDPSNLGFYADYLSSKYALGITLEQAKEMIKGQAVSPR